MISIDLRSWFSKKGQTATCSPPISKDPSVPNGHKWYPNRLLIIATICIFMCINQSIGYIKTTNEQSTSNLKYILMWTPDRVSPFSFWKTGQREFIENKCSFSNCYITSRRDILSGDVTKFDAVIFNGRSLKDSSASDLPRNRSSHQKYIFLNMESSDNQPICNSLFDGFFNWTATYKLKSDIYYSYILIRNMSGDEVGPKIDMTWIDHMTEFNETLKYFARKTKAVALFVSHCNTRNRREKYVEKLKNELKQLNLTLDVYGKCGNMTCPRKQHNKCDDLLKNTYFFYLSFENSFTEDYITEKVKTALLNDVVPILFGGANYSRFLPPGSYIDARKHEPKELASIMKRLITTPEAYNAFFRWKNHYTYHSPENLCRLCAALNNQTMVEGHSIYEQFRHWWNPDYVKRCKNKVWGS